MKLMLRPLLLLLLLLLSSAALQTSLAAPATHWIRVLESHKQRHESVWELSAAFPTSMDTRKTSSEEPPAAVKPHGGEGRSTRVDLVLDSSLYMKGYHGEFSIGTPPQKFRLLLSTLSTTVWVPNFRYTASSRYYNHSQSSTYIANGTTYTTPGLLGGFLSQDVMKVGDLEIASQGFAEINTINAEILPADKFGKSDGVLGLGFDNHIMPSQIKLPFHELVDSGMLHEPLFALYFDRKAGNGALDIGRTNKSHYTGELVYTDVIHQDSWAVKFDDIRVQGKNVTKHRRASFYTALPEFLGPKDEVAALAKTVGAYNKHNEYLIDCDSQGPDIEIRIGGAVFPITKEEYTLHRVDYEDACLWAIQDTFGYIDGWAFGTTFVEKVYTVFNWGDADNKRRMGFALRV